MVTHLEESMQRDIDRISDNVLQMSQLAEKALKDCVRAYVESDRKLAYAVILRDQYIDEKEKEIDRLCLEFIVRQQPIAKQLRFAFSTIKINQEIERVGDHAESIARNVLNLRENPAEDFKNGITRIANLSIGMFHDAVDAFIKQDVERAKMCIEIEDSVDDLRTELTNTFIAQCQDHKQPFLSLYPQIIIIRRLERIGDLARDICNEVLYLCTGEFAKHPGAEAFRILFVDEHNSCRSQMAEALALSMNLPKFIFSSAGVDPKSIDDKTVAFMQEKKIDLSHTTPKAVHQIPNLDHYQVIVILSKEARRALPERTSKTVYLDWLVDDPSAKAGTAEQIHKSYEDTFQYINSQICDLVEAIVGAETCFVRKDA